MFSNKLSLNCYYLIKHNKSIENNIWNTKNELSIQGWNVGILEYQGITVAPQQLIIFRDSSVVL